MNNSDSPINMFQNPRIRLVKNRKQVWIASLLAIVLSVLGFVFSWLDPSIKAPLRPGIEFTGGTQIKLERECQSSCSEVKSSIIYESLQNVFNEEDKSENNFINLAGSKVQIIDESKSVILRLPELSLSESALVIENIKPILGPLEEGGELVDKISASLGGQLYTSSLLSLAIAFVGIAGYISLRYDRTYALLALVALVHDICIVCGLFSWLGITLQVEVNSLFAVALLTIAGYSVNDTVVVFDRIREARLAIKGIDLNTQIDSAVSSTITRTVYTSITTLLPLVALIFFGGSTLYWFAVALATGVVVGSWSSIALSPTLLSLSKNR